MNVNSGIHQSKKDLSLVSIVLHWIVALGIITLALIGLYMTANEAWSLYPYHKSFGLILFPIIVIRVIWRLKQGWPVAVSRYSAVEHSLAKMTHWLLLILIFLMPLAGMIYSGASGHGFGIFGLELVPHNYTEDGQAIAYSEVWRDAGQTAHRYIGNALMVLIALHIAGALKHHFVDRDATLKRMLGKKL
ncbi:MAG: cytochrome b [Pseudomonadota bacterium]